jgi:hypothetical protein
MEETQAIIERVRRINTHYQHLDLAVDKSLSNIKPGQSLLARASLRWDPYLREHLWPVGVGSNRLVIECPGDVHYEPGQVISVLGPVGQPYRFRRNLRNVLLLAYDTAPTPLLMITPMLLANKVSVALVLLGSATRYTTQHLPPELEVIIPEKTSQTGGGKFDHLEWKNSVLTIGWADQVFAVASQNDELYRFRELLEFFGEKRAEIPENYLFGVFRSTQPCGVGACQACMLKMKAKNRETALICMDGPAFDLTTVVMS